MRALVVDEAGGAFRQVELARRAPGPGEVRVRTQASGVNPLDAKIRAGRAAHAKHPLPAVLGVDLAGVVEEVGPGVIRFQPGDAVFGMTGGVGGLQGSLAEAVTVDADLLALRPAQLTPREAAALPLAFITAWEGLVDRALVCPGQRVLIHGGAGGVGHLAVQLAHFRGATVFATGSAASRATIEALGATAIDYRSTTVEQYVAAYTGGEGFDIILDTVGGATLDASFEAVRPYTGHVVSALGWGTHALAPLSLRCATYSGIFTLLPLLTGKGRAHHGDILREATRLVEAGALSVRVDPRHFDLGSALQAHQALEAGSTAGKLVVDVAA